MVHEMLENLQVMIKRLKQNVLIKGLEMLLIPLLR
jgi:hypothetical protein